MRQRVYPVYERYEREKARRRCYDRMDVCRAITRQLLDQGYRGTAVDVIFRDEVQDFTAGELLADLAVARNPNALFYSGDTAQTIARGVGFRFTDIKVLFHEEGHRMARSNAPGSAAAGQQQHQPAAITSGAAINMPLIEHLLVNYRTHSGILSVASLVVDAIKRFFPQFMDAMPRERAFFSGPPPLVLDAVSADDLTILLSGGDARKSQVEFGAHQVILVRTVASVAKLPQELQVGFVPIDTYRKRSCVRACVNPTTALHHDHNFQRVSACLLALLQVQHLILLVAGLIACLLTLHLFPPTCRNQP